MSSNNGDENSDYSNSLLLETEKSDNDADSVEINLVGDPPSVVKKATGTVTTTVIKKKGTRGRVAGPEMLKMLCHFIPVPVYMI